MKQNNKSINGYSNETGNNKQIAISYIKDGVKSNVDFYKINSKHFSTFMPTTWEIKIKSDTLLNIVDKNDDYGDNITIAISTNICDIQEIGKVKNQSLIDNGIKILNTSSEIVNQYNFEINIHQVDLVANDNHYSQKCYFNCKSAQQLLSICLTTSVNDSLNKQVIHDFISGKLFFNLQSESDD